jgi:hypothetical protein
MASEEDRFFSRAFWQQMVSSLMAGMALTGIIALFAWAFGYVRLVVLVFPLGIAVIFSGFYVMTTSDKTKDTRASTLRFLAGIAIMGVGFVSVGLVEQHYNRSDLLVHHHH